MMENCFGDGGAKKVARRELLLENGHDIGRREPLVDPTMLPNVVVLSLT